MKSQPMELTYKIRGADGKEYGPVNLDQLIAWLRESRIGLENEVMRSDMNYWSPAANFTELQEVIAQSAPPTAAQGARPATASRTGDPGALAQMKSGASWFYWIAALSLVNSISAFTGSDWRFILGLGITQFIDALGQSIEGSGKFIALALDLVAAGVLVLFGVFGCKGHLWAFIVGMVLFALDGVLFLLVQDWIGVAFHAFVLYCFFRGFQACRAFNGA
jgi:hypothetical protein